MKCEICDTWTNGITPLRLIVNNWIGPMEMDEIEIEEIYICGNCAVELLKIELSYHSFSYVTNWINRRVKNKKN